MHLTFLDQMFIRRSETQLNATTVVDSRNMIVEPHVGNASVSESTASTNKSELSKVFDFSPHLSANVMLSNLSKSKKMTKFSGNVRTLLTTR